jgi:hypothetical protein
VRRRDQRRIGAVQRKRRAGQASQRDRAAGVVNMSVRNQNQADVLWRMSARADGVDNAPRLARHSRVNDDYAARIFDDECIGDTGKKCVNLHQSP